MEADIQNQSDTWCKRDGHHLFELFDDFNSYIDSREEQLSPLIQQLIDSGLSHPSKAFYAGDKEAYEQALQSFRIIFRHEALSKDYFVDNSGGDGHWFERNESRLKQLIDKFIDKSVVPFIGAGVSVAGGFPTWADHLRQQGRTAGIDFYQIEEWIEQGQYEQIIDHIEKKLGRDVFSQEIRDVFGRTGKISDITFRIQELFSDTIITTNYDRLIEQVFDIGNGPSIQAINSTDATESPDAEKTTIYKIHGDIDKPLKCILSKSQYDDAYGENEIDMEKPIPSILRYHYLNSNLLFIGCSLQQDRTIQVFKEVKKNSSDSMSIQHFTIESVPADEGLLVKRNAELASLGIAAIWFEPKRYDLVEKILRTVRNELRYLKIFGRY